MALPVITHNSPAAGSISWTAFTIQFGGTSYPVAAGNTARRFVYWKHNGGTPSLVHTDTLPADLAPEDLLLFLNRGGIGLLAPATDVIDGSLIVSGTILGDALAANTIDGDRIKGNTITGNLIAANAVTGDKIAANSITASKLSIGAVADSSVVNGSFEDGVEGWGLGTPTGTEMAGTADIVTGVASSGAFALRITRSTGVTTVTQLEVDAIPVTAAAGRTWYISATVGAGATINSAFALRAYWLAANKTTVVATATIATGQQLTTTWRRVEGVAAPPATARYLRVGLVNMAATNGAAIYVDAVEAMEVIVSAQIGDGQVTTPKLVAGAVTAEKIEADLVIRAGQRVVAGAAAGKRAELTPSGLSAYSAAGTQTVRIDGEDNLITGDLRTAASGARVEMIKTDWAVQDAGIRLYDSGGGSLSLFTNYGAGAHPSISTNSPLLNITLGPGGPNRKTIQLEDTGWQPHGGNTVAGIGYHRALEWRIFNGVVYWRGQVSRSGDWSTGNTGDLIVTNLPNRVRPAQVTPLVSASDLGAPVSVILWPDGSIRVYAAHSRSAWPHIGGSSILA